MAAVVQRWTGTQAREAAASIVRVLRDAGHTAYFAGGCVRDALLGAEPVDFDIATSARPDAIGSLFRRTTAVGASFGVVLVIERGVTVEVATFRSDGPYSDKRRPDHIEFADAEQDAKRRDFTVNALFFDPFAQEPGQSVIDFVGGLADLRAGLIRAVGDPEQRLAEDHLRALRAVRFAARYGFAIELETAAAIRAHASDLSGVSRERIGEEFRRMMDHPSRARAVGLLCELGLDTVLLGVGSGEFDEVSVLAGLQQCGLEPGGGWLANTADHNGDVTGEPGDSEREGGVSFPACLAAIAFDRGEVGSAAVVPALVRRWREVLCLSNEERNRLREILLGVVEMVSGWAGAPVAQRKRWAVSPWFPEALAVIRARDPLLGATFGEDIEALARDGIGLAPEPMLDGNDLHRLGIPTGPAFARVLAEVYDAQLEGRVQQKAEAEVLAVELGRSGGV